MAAAGGTVEFPAGIFLSGPITLKSAVNLQLDSGAILRMLPFGKYPVTWTTNSTGYFFTANNFLSGSSLHDLEISGSGWIQGQGEPWWPWANTNGAVRPIMLKLNSCNHTLIQSVTLSNSPEFHIAVSGGGNTTVQGVTVRANPSSDPLNPGHNTDACDVSGTNILVQNNDISVGDDNYTCGGGTSGMLLTNNTYGFGHGISIGSFTSPSVSNMTVINCTLTNTEAGIRIKTDRDRGGYVHNISYYNLSMSNVKNPILIYTEYTNTVSMLSRAGQHLAGGCRVLFQRAAYFHDAAFSRHHHQQCHRDGAVRAHGRAYLGAARIVRHQCHAHQCASLRLKNVRHLSGKKCSDY